MASAAIPQQVQQPQRISRLTDLGIVHLNELSTVKPLELGARFITSFCNRDLNYPRLHEITASATRENYTVPEIGIPSSSSFVPFAVKTRDLPVELVNQPGVRSGLLPELDLVWFAQNNDLYLWNFVTGSLQRFDAINSPILGVRVTSPRSDVFADVVKHVLVIISRDNLHIYAVSRNAADSSQITVFDTGFVFSLANFGVPRIVSTKTGRIFFSAERKGVSIYEAIYDNKKRWFSKTSGIVTLVDDHGGWFGGSQSGEQIIDLAVDESREKLYSLSSKSTIRAYSFTNTYAGGALRHQHTYAIDTTRIWMKSSLSSQLTTQDARFGDLAPIAGSSNVQSYNPGYQAGVRTDLKDKAAAAWEKYKHSELVAINCLSKEQSESCPLVGVTSQGVRVYFRTHSVRNSEPLRSAILCEPRVTGPGLDVMPGLGRLMERDFFVAASKEAASTQTSRLFVSYMDSVRILHQTDLGAQPPFAEISGFLSVNGHVVDLQMHSSGSWNQSSSIANGNTAASQYTGAAEEALVLTTSGLYSVRARYFIERLETINEETTGQLLQAYGHTELCCAALAVATRTDQFTKQQREVAAALYFKLGGLPVFRKDIEATRSTYVRDPSSAIGSTQSRDVAVRLSSLFDGMAAYSARLLSQFWTQKIVVKKTANGETTSKLNVDLAKFEHIYSTLSGLNTFLENNRAFSDSVRPQYSQHVYADDISVLSKAEEQSIAAVSQLVKNCQQGVGFFLLLASEISKTPSGLDTFISYFSPEHQQALLSSTFRDIFIQSSGQQLFSRELVAYFVNFVLNNGGNIELVAKQLQDRCSSYCTADEILTYKALQCLRAANEIKRSLQEGIGKNVDLPPNIKAANNNQENEARLRNLAESVSLLRRAAGSLSGEALQDLVTMFVSHRYFEGCAQVILAVTEARDPADVVAGFVRDQQPQDDPRKVLYEMKCGYYKLLLDSLKDMDSKSPEGEAAESVMLASKDEAFHYFLYDWLLARGEESRLASVHTPFLLRYLRVRSKSNLRAAELFWRHYRAREPLTAAKILLEIGCGTLPITITQRTEYLARAMTICNSGLSYNVDQLGNQLIASISSQLTIAKIQEAVLNRLETDKQAAAEQKEAGIRVLNLGLLTLHELYSDFTNLLGYHDLSLWIIEVTDNRDQFVIQDTWRRLFTFARQQDDLYERQHFTHISSLIQRLGQQFHNSSFVFPVDYLIPFTEGYGQDFLPDAPHGWIVEAFLKAGVRHRTVYHELLSILRTRASPFHRQSYATAVAEDVIYLLQDWIKFQAADHFGSKGFVSAGDIELVAENCIAAAEFREFCAAHQVELGV